MVNAKTARAIPTLPDSRLLRRTFLLLWLVDMVTAALLILVPYASELNPITVYFYSQFGLPGVVLAACCYAAVVIAIGSLLSSPLDAMFVAALIILYTTFVFNNALVLLFDWSLLEVFE